jgi:hypothetical protein
MYLNRFSHFPRLVHLANRVTHQLTILEVGSYTGSSLLAWDEASGKSANLIVIDSWHQYDVGDIPDSAAAMYDASLRFGKAERMFWRNVEAAGLQPRLKVYKGDSRKLLPTLNETLVGRIDLVFIDGDHRYDYVKVDIENSKPLIREEGILCGDDYCIDEYPGVTKAVVENFGYIWGRDGIWAVRKVDGDWKDV